MALIIAYVVNVVLAGLLTGNEFGSWAIVHRGLANLPLSNRIQAEQALTRRYGGIMPGFMSLTIASFLPVLLLTRDWSSPAFRFGVAGMLAYVAMLAVTLIGNVPINNQLLGLTADPVSGDEFEALRDRWDRLHTIRNVLNIAGLILAVLAAVSGSRSR
ncbi:MAG: DUF1772 domain-containing protein [Chloroflexota bacterium]|nr:DUF1772 domain-containing protein [Chloroflexota bacterium]